MLFEPRDIVSRDGILYRVILESKTKYSESYSLEVLSTGKKLKILEGYNKGKIQLYGKKYGLGGYHLATVSEMARWRILNAV